jgi:hypothetical protein
MAIMKTLTINGITYRVVPPVTQTTVTLLASAWIADDKHYYQVVTIPGVTLRSRVDLKPSVEQLEIFYEKDVTFSTENNGGVVTVYVVGQKPTNDYTIQADIVEVTA